MIKLDETEQMKAYGDAIAAWRRARRLMMAGLGNSDDRARMRAHRVEIERLVDAMSRSKTADATDRYGEIPMDLTEEEQS